MHLTHHRYALIAIINADMNVHAANDHASPHALQVIGNRLVPLLVRVPLRPPTGKGGRGCGHCREPVAARDPGHAFPQMTQMLTGLGRVSADPCCDLDL